jgi:5-methylcytosine-specific restriction endonuclease McrA
MRGFESGAPMTIAQQKRVCRKCGNEFPLDKDHFGHTPQGGYRYACRQCVRMKARRDYRQDPERSIERSNRRRSTVFTQSERAGLKRRLVLRDGGFFCFYCKRELDWSFHIDHKTPIGSGGAHELSNYALACLQCNQEKHNKDVDEYRRWLRKNGEEVRF